jgi:FAD/FMN-containing dehydrogenase
MSFAHARLMTSLLALASLAPSGCKQICLGLGPKSVRACGDGNPTDDPVPAACPADSPAIKVRSYNNQVLCTKVARVVIPEGIADVQAAVQYAAQNNVRVRVIGSRHSATSILCTDGVVIDMSPLNHILGPPEMFEGQMTIEAEAGVLTFDLSRYLDDHGWSLGFVTSGFRLPTVGGAVATGTHGSSTVNSAVVSNAVQSVTAVLADGSLQDFSAGTTGVTDPDLWKSLRASLGFLGVVVKARIAVQPRFNLKVRTQVYYGSDALFEPDGAYKMVEGCDWGQIVWFPMATAPALGRLYSFCGTRTDEPRMGNAENRLLDVGLPQWGQSIGKESLQSATCHESDDGVCALELLRLNLIHDDPNETPYVGQTCEGQTCTDVVGPPHRLMSSNISQPSSFHPSGGFSERDWEIVIPRQNAQAALSAGYEYFKEHHICLPLLGVFIRFAPVEDETLVAHTVAAGDFKAGEPAMFFELPVYVPTGISCANQDEYEQVYIDLAAMLVQQFGGRPHWAKNRRETFLLPEICARYGDHLTRFADVVRRVDPRGRFANQFGVDLGLTWPQSPPIPADTTAPSCVVDPSTLPPLGDTP